MVGFFVLVIIAALLIAAINAWVFPVPQIVWGLFALLVIVVLAVLLLGAVDGGLDNGTR